MPEEWLVAGPGKRAEVGAAAGRKTFRFAPAVELPKVALMAGELRSYATEIDGVTFEAPEGAVTVNGENHHIAKTALIGKIGPDGLIHTEWSSDGAIEPDPFLEGYEWAEGLS